MIRAFIFDMDGVVLDSERLVRDVWLHTASEFGYTIPPEIYFRVLGRNAHDAERILFEALGEDFPLTSILSKARSVIKNVTAENGWPVKGGVREILALLSEYRFPTAVATSTGRNEAISRLTSAGLRGFFQQVCGGDEVKRGKPAPDLFRLASRRLGVEASQCLVIEDSEFGIQGAHAAGMKAVLIPDLKEPTAATRTLAFKVFDSISAAKDFLVGLTLSESGQRQKDPEGTDGSSGALNARRPITGDDATSR